MSIKNPYRMASLSHLRGNTYLPDCYQTVMNSQRLGSLRSPKRRHNPNVVDRRSVGTRSLLHQVVSRA